MYDNLFCFFLFHSLSVWYMLVCFLVHCVFIFLVFFWRPALYDIISGNLCDIIDIILYN